MAKKFKDTVLEDVTARFKASGITQAELSRLSGVPKNAICQTFTHKQPLRSDKVSAILAVLAKKNAPARPS